MSGHTERALRTERARMLRVFSKATLADYLTISGFWPLGDEEARRAMLQIEIGLLSEAMRRQGKSRDALLARAEARGWARRAAGGEILRISTTKPAMAHWRKLAGANRTLAATIKRTNRFIGMLEASETTTPKKERKP